MATEVTRQLDIIRTMAELPSELPREIEVLRAGSWSHVYYGEIKITAGDLEQFVAHYNERVLVRDVPLDIQHFDSSEGAPGWVMGLRTDGERLLAEVEWTDYGERLVTNRRFRYVSPEFYPVWTRPTDKQKFRNVLSKIALTNNPFFRELEPLTAADPANGMLLFTDPGPSAGDQGGSLMANETNTNETQQGAVPPVPPPPETSVTAAELSALQAQNAELEARLLAAERQQAEAVRELEQRQMTEQISALRFGAEGRSQLVPAAVEGAVELALSMTDETRQQFVAFLSGLQMVETGQRGQIVMSEAGSPEADQERWASLVATAVEGGMEYADACASVAKAEPELAARVLA
jgi:hypothetical protein